MKALIQRTSGAHVVVNDNKISEIGRGLVVFLGIAKEDEEKDIKYVVGKIINMRIFEGEDGKLDLSVNDIKGEILLVSQFTLCGDCSKGRRPDFFKAAPIDEAKILYKKAAIAFKETGLKIQEGEFQAYMKVNLVNDGPVTIMLDSKK